MGKANIATTGRVLLQPDIIVAPVLWLASDHGAQVTGRRFVGKDWDDSLPLAQAAEGACEPPVIREA
jgi:3-oxoacyl-[acyl-carrier protein] reductase